MKFHDIIRKIKEDDHLPPLIGIGFSDAELVDLIFAVVNNSNIPDHLKILGIKRLQGRRNCSSACTKKTYCVVVDRGGIGEEVFTTHYEFQKEPFFMEVEALVEQEDIGYIRDYCKIEFWEV